MATKQNISELAKSVNLPEKHTKQVVEYLKHDMMLSLYRFSVPTPAETEADKFSLELNEKIVKLYKQKHKKEFNPEIHKKNKRLPLFLMGPPGQGKTASYIAAAEELCKELGLHFVRDVTDSYVPKQNDFVMVVQECAGENSAITFGGVPKAEEITLPNGEKQTVLKKALNYRFTVFSQCAGGVLLFDDAANAASVIQNVLLPVAQNNSFQGMKIPNALIGFTGNLGALDGTYVSEQSSALLTRVLPMFVTDTVDDFLDRGYKYYNDELGDLGYFAFLHRNRNDFAALPENGQKSGFACSRSHDNFIQSARSVVERNGGRGIGEANSLFELQSLARSCFGPEYAQKLIAYLHSYIQGADPLARGFIQDNKQDFATLNAKYNGGSSADGISFGYQFATACGDYAVNAIVEIRNANKKDGKPNVDLENKDFHEVIKRFGNALLALNPSEFTYSIEHLKNKLAIYIPEFSQKTNAKVGVELTAKAREVIATIINDLENCTADKREALIATITDYDKIASNSNLGVKKGGRQKMN